MLTLQNPPATPDTPAVPPRFRGVWRRSLLRAPGMADDCTTTVFWLQTSRWHADIRIPAGRPDFAGVTRLAECNDAQWRWLATQQGFAGVTRVHPTTLDTHWLRVVDFQPPADLPDEGHAEFRDGMLVETGIHADYLEHWHRVPGSDQGFAVFRQLDARRPAWLLVAGHCVMLVRPRMTEFGAGGWGETPALRTQLDFEISFGDRTDDGWLIRHSTFPWREGQAIAVDLQELDDGSLSLRMDGERSRWEVLEWTPPAA